MTSFCEFTAAGLVMDYRNLGKAGVKVSPICLGTMMFGGQTSEADSIKIIHQANDQGVNFIDTDRKSVV